ncbi:Tfp pilus assembly protein PilE [Sporosarcina luteola]|nr:Tfp pilus assembly protein PilE [Sporosarcina luteola]
MARKRGNGLLLATIAAGAYAYFSKKENRDKAQVAFNNMKTKVESFINSQKLNRSDATKPGFSDPYDLQDNKMVSEGSQTSVHYYNQEVEDKSKESEEDGLYRKKQTANLTGTDSVSDGSGDSEKTETKND